MNVNFKEYECETVFAQYSDNNNTAIQLIGKEGTDDEGELVTVATVNGETEVPENIVGIKNWSENEGMIQALVDAKVINPEIEFIEPSGFVNIGYFQLTDQALEELEAFKEAK